MKKNRRRADGFSLLELLIAVAVLLTGIVAVAQLVPVVLNSNLKARNDSSALILAQMQMEQFVSQTLSTGNQVASGTYTYTDNFMPYYTGVSRVVAIGTAPAAFTAAAGAAPPAATTAGSTLVTPAAGEPYMDWSVAAAANYSKMLQVTDKCYEMRWNVMTFFGNFNGAIRPVAKRYIISARNTLNCTSTTPGYIIAPPTLRAIVSWTNQ